MNLVQLFRPNRYLQYDRVGDTNQLNVGFTSRVFGSTTGREILTATIGTSRYYSDQRVTLPGETPRTSKSGDYLMQARVDLYDSWNLEAGYQWNAATQQTDQGNIRFQLKPANNTVINADYRYQRESTLDQGGLSFGWAVNERWNLLGRAVYSFEDEQFVDQFAAIEYGGCCWGIRLIFRERVSRDIEEDDTSIGIQFVLKGFTEIGNSVRSQLEGGILGYSDL
jgi:LPS-assembly protein